MVSNINEFLASVIVVYTEFLREATNLMMGNADDEGGWEADYYGGEKQQDCLEHVDFIKEYNAKMAGQRFVTVGY